jgi:tetratricopeptide (TPR) repeat protein
MIFLIRRVWRDFPQWERPAQIALLMALLLLPVTLAVAFLGPQDVRVPSLIGAGGLILIMQITVLWANRGMVTPFTQAQRHFLAEDFEAARTLLEGLHAEGKADARALTLLGNTYRQLGNLEDSHRVLYEALNKAPNHHYPLYGFGRTLLSEGNYGEAAAYLGRALAAGAPVSVRVDVAEALFRAGDFEGALDNLHAMQSALGAEEPYRQLMAQYLLYRLNAVDVIDEELVHSGLPYWQAVAERFAHSRYGTDLALDIQHMRGRTE